MAEELLVFENDDASYGLERQESVMEVDTITPKKELFE